MKNFIESVQKWDQNINYDVELSNKTVNKCLTVSIDTEYNTGLYLSLQIVVPELEAEIFVVNKRLEVELPSYIEAYKSLQHDSKPFATHFFYLDIEPHLAYNTLHHVLSVIHKEKGLHMPKVVEVLFYFSYKDLWAAFGFNDDCLERNNNFSCQDWVIRLRGIKGKFWRGETTYKLIDLKGMSNLSLKGLTSSYGFEMESKDLLDSYKDNKMHLALLSDNSSLRRDFIKYAMDDAKILSPLLNKIRSSFEDICLNELDFPKERVPKSWPNTLGACIAHMFQAYVFVHAIDKNKVDENTFLKAIFKVGHLGTLNRSAHYPINRLELELERKEIFKKDSNNPELLKKHLSTYNYSFDALNNCSINYLNSFDTKQKNYASAFVVGGRCINEQPNKFRGTNVLDVDIQSCYGKAMADFEYPIGTPFIYKVSVNDEGPTLRDFIKEFSREMVPGLWTITVSGKLNFTQSLIYSKTFTSQNTECTETLEPKDHILLRKEIHNGILTSDLLNTIDLVSTSIERKGFYELRVQSAIIYLNKFRCTSPGEWCLKVLKKKKDLNYYWYSFSIGEIVTPLLSRRELIKLAMREEVDPVKRAALHAEQTTAKLINNTIYGVVTSRHFRINNLVVANQVTARARNNAWLLSIPLGFLNTITDGGLFEANKVNRLRSECKEFRKPGFNSFSCLESFSKCKYIEQVPLLEATWIDPKAKNFIGLKTELELRTRVKNHCEKFWSNYKLSLDFEIELKLDHTAILCSYYSKAHYFIINVHGEKKFKTRGVMSNEKDLTFNILNPELTPLHYFLVKISGNKSSDYLPITRKFTEKKHISSRDYLIKKKKDPSFELLPGDFLQVEHEFRLGIHQFPCNTLQEYNRMIRFRRLNLSFDYLRPEIAEDLYSYPKAAKEYLNGTTKRGRRKKQVGLMDDIRKSM